MSQILTYEVGSQILQHIWARFGSSSEVRKRLEHDGFTAQNADLEFSAYHIEDEKIRSKREQMYIRYNHEVSFLRQARILLGPQQAAKVPDPLPELPPDPFQRDGIDHFKNINRLANWRREKFANCVTRQRDKLSRHPQFRHTRRGLINLTLEVARECGEPLGLQFDRKRSHKDQPSAFVPVNANWNLRWYVRSTKFWMPANTISGPGFPPRILCQFELVLCRNDISPPVEKFRHERGLVLPIPYRLFVTGFGAGFGGCDDPEGLEFILRADFSLLRQVHTYIREVVAEYF